MGAQLTAAVGTASRREQRGWYFDEWASAGFTTTVLTGFIGPHLTTVAKVVADPSGFVHPNWTR
jgi:UMF1 family MFS transporter